MKKYFVYIIHSLKYDIHYIGHTNNLQDRLTRHNNNRSPYTRNKGPWELIISTECSSKKEAYQLELYLKKLKNYKLAIEYLKKINPQG
ncbi:MAG: hypothetical protein STSR0008_25680 [Ignavibacterium sp.]